MNVTGYQLKEAIKMKSLELAAIQSQFDESLYKFEGEDKESPEEIARKIVSLETDIASLQTAQSQYNLAVKVKVGDMGMIIELLNAVKLVGGAGRLSKMWRTAAQGKSRDRWDRQTYMSRSKDDEIATATVTRATALKEAKSAEKFASQLRGAIAAGNTTVVDINWVSEELLN